MAETPTSPETPENAQPTDSSVNAEVTEAAETAGPTEAAPEAAAPAQPPEEPTIAATIEVPPLGVSGGGDSAPEDEGGEWNLLLDKIRAWMDRLELDQQWERLRGPLKLVGILIAVLLLMRVYGSVIRTIDGIPVVSGLLELVGLVVFVRFCISDLAPRSRREQLLADWKQRWQEFRGNV